MTRAAFLPTPGDPFLNKLWFKLFEKYWQDEVDKLYVCINSPIEPDVVAFLIKMYKSNPKVTVVYHDRMLEHGWALKEIIKESNEDLVLLIEDDGLIFKSGAVKEQFDRIENGEVDIIGGHRQSSSLGIAQATQLKFNRPSTEAFLWPNFLFTKMEYLKKTDLVFGNKGFKAGETVPYLNWIPTEDEAMDTFGWMAIQLYAQELRVITLDQNHAMADDLEACASKTRAWEPSAKWVHWGSLSSMMSNFLFYDNGCPIGDWRSSQRIDINHIPKPVDLDTNRGAKADIESRVANTWLAYDLTHNDCHEILEFKIQYHLALLRLVESFGLDMGNITMKKKIYESLFNL